MTDLTLLQQWRQMGDASAFREIVTRHAGMVYGTCRRILRNASDAEDVAQECFETLVTTPKEPEVHLAAWLHQVATNRSLSHLRSDKKRREREKTFEDAREKNTDVAWDDIYEHVDESIESLPPKHREPLIAVFLENQSRAAVARKVSLDGAFLPVA